VNGRWTQNLQTPQKMVGLRILRVLRCSFGIAACCACTLRLEAHDVERTQVTLTFARDGSFVLDVLNDPDWLKLRLERFPGPFSDRIVMWVDGREIRPASEEYIAVTGVHRMRGTMPLDAQTLRWYYGLVIDPYPLTIRRADGKIAVEEIAGDAWSGTIDLRGQFSPATLTGNAAALFIVAALAVPLVFRLSRRR
jgi:hypothetical protein